MSEKIKALMSDEANARSAAYRAVRSALPIPEARVKDTHKVAGNVARKATGDVFKALKARVKRDAWTEAQEIRARAVLAKAGIDAYALTMTQQGFTVSDAVKATAMAAHNARYAERRTMRTMGAGNVPATTIDSVFA